MVEVLFDENVELRYQEGSSNKYYRVRIRYEDGTWTARGEYARIGLSPNTNLLYQGKSEEAAREAARKQLRQKISKGYRIYHP